jgi:hypothetical protein
MKKSIVILSFLAVSLVLAAAIAISPTTIEDFFLPGSQIGQSGNIETPDRCDNCHGGYDIAIEPAFNWRGSMMAQAARDPLFYACLAIANQDAPGAGDLCLRCHTPDGWLNGRCEPTDGSALNNNDRQGVQCDFCHKMVKPTKIGVNPYPDSIKYNSSIYGANAYDQDQAYIAQILPVPGTSANGMYLADANNAKRGPFTDATGRHQMLYSPFHRDASHCGTCHDVSNPVFTRKGNESMLKYSANTMNLQAETFDLRLMFPIERTYSEYMASGYATGAYGVEKKICQDCHMRDVNGKAASMKDAKIRPDMPLHDFTGGNTFAPLMIKDKWAGEVNAAALDAGIGRARAQLKSATNLSVSLSEPTGTETTITATVRVTNNTGHKFPTGYPEGRRAWIHFIAYDLAGKVTFESGKYGEDTISTQNYPRIYHCEPGISKRLSFAVKGDYSLAGPSYHMALNDTVYFDNRIPPAGYTNAKLNEYQSPVIEASYADGVNYDVVNYTVPSTTTRVEAKLYYQTTTKEFVTFLRDQNTTNTAGTELYTLWDRHGRSAPELINSATYPVVAPVIPPLDAKFTVAVTRGTSKAGTYATTKVIVTSNGTPIVGATLTASYTGPSSGTLTLTTDANGLGTLNTKAVKNPLTSWCFTINNVTKTGYDYIIPKPLTRLCEGETLKSAEMGVTLAEAGLKVYPNPFSDRARFEFISKEDTNAKIDIYDLNGRIVETVFDKYVTAGVTNYAEFIPENNSRGIYIYRLKMGSQLYNGKITFK